MNTFYISMSYLYISSLTRWLSSGGRLAAASRPGGRAAAYAVLAAQAGAVRQAGLGPGHRELHLGQPEGKQEERDQVWRSGTCSENFSAMVVRLQKYPVYRIATTS